MEPCGAVCSVSKVRNTLFCCGEGGGEGGAEGPGWDEGGGGWGAVEGCSGGGRRAEEGTVQSRALGEGDVG